MKIIYSQLQKLIPELKKTAKEVADDLTLISHFCSGLEKINGEEVIDLEVRHNGADCLGYFGLAKELSVLYNFPLSLPKTKSILKSKLPLTPVRITSKSGVKRLMATTMVSIKNKTSPAWLKDFLKLHDINSLNLLIDLTNYVMIFWGLPCHAFDLDKLNGGLVWQDSTQKKNFVTFDKTKLEISKGALEISDQEKPVSLTFIGGQNSGIEINTTQALIEMAIYDPTRVRKDSRQYKIITEASIRLGKFLDPELIPTAFNHLITLIQKYCQGQISTQIYNYYPKKDQLPKILFDPRKPSLYSGINIPSDFVLKTLENLGCQLKNQGQNLLVRPPSIRKDIGLEEDLVEEIIRFWGYDNIPTDQPVSSKKLPDITPRELHVIEHFRKILTDLGYDETRSWPLVSSDKIVNKEKTIYTQNSVNSNFPALRTHIKPSLEIQKKQYEKYKVSPVQIFEIGKIYYKEDKKFKETYSLGLYNSDSKQTRKDALFLLSSLRITNLNISSGNYFEYSFENLPKEINLKKLKTLDPKAVNTRAYELKKQIITLDANLTLDKPLKPKKLIKKYSQKIGDKYLWQLRVTDIYRDPKTNKYRHTLRASYYNLESSKAKSIHLKAFNLSKV